MFAFCVFLFFFVVFSIWAQNVYISTGIPSHTPYIYQYQGQYVEKPILGLSLSKERESPKTRKTQQKHKKHKKHKNTQTTKT